MERPVYLLFNEILKINQNLIPWFVLNTLKNYKPKRWEDKVIKGDLSYIRQKFCFLSTFPGFKRKIQYLYSVIFPQKTFLSKNMVARVKWHVLFILLKKYGLTKWTDVYLMELPITRNYVCLTCPGPTCYEIKYNFPKIEEISFNWMLFPGFIIAFF